MEQKKVRAGGWRNETLRPSEPTSEKTERKERPTTASKKKRERRRRKERERQGKDITA